MNIIDRAKAAVKKYTAVSSVTIKTADKSISLDISALHTRINLGVDQDGNITNARKSYVSISESILTDHNYPVRNANKEIILKGHLIYVEDSFGTNIYSINAVIADDTVGNLVCMLSDYNDAS